MTSAKVALALGLALLALLCYLAARGFTAVTEILVTVVALVAMISGGSWLTARLGIYDRRTRGPVPAGPRAAGGTGVAASTTAGAGHVAEGGAAGADRYCPGADLAGRGRPGGTDAGR